VDVSTLLAAYLRQQKELALPDPILGPRCDARRIESCWSSGKNKPSTPHARHDDLNARAATTDTVSPVGRPPAPKKKADPLAKLARLPQVSESRIAAPSSDVRTAAPLTFEQKRDIFKQLYARQCAACPLAASRRSFVFGAGNVDAPLVIVGEAPGAEEDLQGLPFVGAAGQLLTELLLEVGLDRKKDVFITNVLKCRPPENRTPSSAEIVACLPLLYRQIEVIAPRMLLLLGRIAAHALLETANGIGALRGKFHQWRGIPAIVTYHPAAILRSPEYRAPTSEDMRTVARYLKEGIDHGASR